MKNAIRFAVDVCFRFDFRAMRGPSLWSKTERVWLGSNTFLHWAMCLEDIDIPWTVATAPGAPKDVEQLREEVLTELVAYWDDRLTALPKREQPNWLPLP